MKLYDNVPGTKVSFEKALLSIHKSYLYPITALMKKIDINGMAHITGGGLYDNIPRILPNHVAAIIRQEYWKTQNILSFMQSDGKISTEEMFRVFNMGIGYVVIVSIKDVDIALKTLKLAKQSAKVIGEIKKGEGNTIIV